MSSQPDTLNPISDLPDYHVPVLLDEVIDGLAVKPGQWYIDGTIGGGGHAAAILAAGGNVLGLDQDEEAVDQSEARLLEGKERRARGTVKVVKANFRDMAEVADREGIASVAGVLLDLGVSSHQLDEVERGFGFKSDKLDMRMDTHQPITAADLLEKLPESDLARLFSDLGEERLARLFAKAIKRRLETLPITSGAELAEVVWQASPASYRHGTIHPATRVFQALRLAVNDELGSLETVLPQAVSLLQMDGRLAVISFHSLEDRIVKRFIQTDTDLEPLTKTPITATQAELERNPRSRSAKLRVARKLV